MPEAVAQLTRSTTMASTVLFLEAPDETEGRWSILCASDLGRRTALSTAWWSRGIMPWACHLGCRKALLPRLERGFTVRIDPWSTPPRPELHSWSAPLPSRPSIPSCYRSMPYLSFSIHRFTLPVADGTLGWLVGRTGPRHGTIRKHPLGSGHAQSIARPWTTLLPGSCRRLTTIGQATTHVDARPAARRTSAPTLDATI